MATLTLAPQQFRQVLPAVVRHLNDTAALGPWRLVEAQQPLLGDPVRGGHARWLSGWGTWVNGWGCGPRK